MKCTFRHTIDGVAHLLYLCVPFANVRVTSCKVFAGLISTMLDTLQLTAAALPLTESVTRALVPWILVS